MRFTLSSTVLNNRLQSLSKVINAKNTLPILGSFLFDIRGGKMTITASDGENVMTSEIPLSECDGEASFAVPNRTILDAVKEIPEQPLTFTLDTDTNEITVTYQNGHYQFTAQNANEYPHYDSLSGEVHEFTLSAEVLVNNIGRTLFATDNNDIRPVMNGIYFDLKADCLAFVASDGHKLVRCLNYTVKSETPASFILPKKPAALLKNTLTKDSGDVVVKWDGHAAEIIYAEGMLRCRLIEGTFPNYNAAIPQNNSNELTIDRKALLSALRRVLPFASMSSQLIRFRLSAGKLELSSEDLDFATSAEEQIICDYNGQSMQIGFRGDFLTEILNSYDTTEVKLLLGDPSRAGIVVPTEQPENEDILMLIMPLLLND